MTKILNKQYLIMFLVGIIGFSAAFFFIQAQTIDDIAYPVKELGNCKSESDCRAFCDQPENIIACVNFAEKQDLISPEEANKARKFAEAGAGPGNCKTPESCEAFCEKIENLEACLAYAEDNGLMEQEEIEEAKKVLKAKTEGAAMPGNCQSKTECENYCNDYAHMEECVAFAEKADLIPADELEDAKKAIEAIKSGIKPPPCRGKKACDAYCSEPSHLEECLSFAEAAGFISEEEAADARKALPFMMRGEMPGNCKTKEECDVYCADESHLDECAEFAFKAGFMDEEEYEMYKKTGGKGPGNCKSKEECEEYCDNPENQEVCFNFALERGLIPEEDLEEMKEGLEQLKEAVEMAPEEVSDCLKSTIGEDNLNKIQEGTFIPSPKIGDQVRDCYEQSMSRSSEEEWLEEESDRQVPEEPLEEEFFEEEGFEEEEWDIPEAASNLYRMLKKLLGE